MRVSRKRCGSDRQKFAGEPQAHDTIGESEGTIGLAGLSSHLTEMVNARN